MGELFAPKCTLGALGAHGVPVLAGWLAGCLRQGLRQGQGLRQRERPWTPIASNGHGLPWPWAPIALASHGLPWPWEATGAIG